MEWVDISTKKKSKACFCRLEWAGERRGSSDGSIYCSRALEGDEVCSHTSTWLPPKLAQVGEVIVLVHPDTGKEQKWIVVHRGKSRWLNENSQVLFGAGYA